MTRPPYSFAAMAVIAAGLMTAPHTASATPGTSALALKVDRSVGATMVEQVRYYGRGYGGRGYGWGGVGGGLVAGAIIGGALAAPYYYGPYYRRPYYPAPAYSAPPPAYYPAPAGGDAVAYCASRFRSYDPRSGSYMGYDGLRHSCP